MAAPGATLERIAPPQVEIAPLLRSMPMSEVPLNREIDSGVKHVAGHELNHALVAYGMGVSVSGISVIPEGNTLGVTMLANPSLGQAQIVAAAGSVHAHDGKAMGYGSDMYKVNMIGKFFGGVSADQARSIAASILSGYSREVREKAAEIVAYMGQVSGARLPDIIARAKYEVRLEKIRNNPRAALEPEEPETNNQFVNLESMLATDKKETDEVMTIEHTPEGDKVQWHKNGVVIKEQVICKACGGMGSHTSECPVALEQKKQFANKLERQGTVFIYKPKGDITSSSSGSQTTV